MVNLSSSLFGALIFSLLTPAFAAPPNDIFPNTGFNPVQSYNNNATLKLQQKAHLASVNINKADAETIAHELSGIGIKRAQAIVAYREQHGPFKSIDDLINIKGIGKKTIEKNRDKIII